VIISMAMLESARSHLRDPGEKMAHSSHGYLRRYAHAGCAAVLAATQLSAATPFTEPPTPTVQFTPSEQSTLVASWTQSDAIQARLSAGEVVMQSALGSSQANVQAAIRVRAVPQVVWNLITRCQSVASFVPGLRRCERLQTAADGSWSIVEHDIRYSILMPMIRSIVRSQYQPPHRVDFTGVGGNVKSESGSWVLDPAADGQATTVEYSISIEPGFFVPRAVVRRSLSKELPVMLTGLRAVAEQIAASAPVAAQATPLH
jgi:carbon monoxide dehydrogenase subunit G